MAKAKRTKVRCGTCRKESEILTSSIEADGPTVWKCPRPECGATNSRQPK